MPFEIPTGLNVEPGTYPAVLESVEEDTGNFGLFRKWTWLVEHDGKIDPLTQLTSANTGPQSKSYQMLTALLGRDPQAGEKIADPTGTRVLLQLSKNEKGFMKVDAVLPFTEPQQVLPGVPR